MLVLMRVFFMGWLLFGEGIFIRKCKRRNHFWLRVFLAIFISLGFATLIGYLGFWFMDVLSQIDVNHILFYSLVNVIAHCLIFLMSFLAIRFCFLEKRRTVLFCAIAGYSFANIALTISDSICYFFPELKFINTNEIIGWDIVFYFGSYLLVYLVLWLIFGRFKGEISSVSEANPLATYFLSIAEFIVAIVVKSISSILSTTNQQIVILANIPIVMCSVLVLSLQLYLSNDYLKKRENEAIVHESYMKLQQYKLTKETIDIINIKCHDLKHQLRTLKDHKDEVDDEYLRQLEDSITIYDSTIHTGNDALDVLLTEKNLLCKKKGIQLTSLVDGSSLSFISKADLYSLFGNALDNAIEYVEKLPNEYKIIKLSVRNDFNCIAVKVSNYLEKEQLELSDGLPKTHKNEKQYHGYGLKSIKYIVEKYHGDFHLNTRNHEFSISILFVSPTKK